MALPLPTFQQHVKYEAAYVTPVLSQHQDACLERLIQDAICDAELQERILGDDLIYQKYDITYMTWARIKACQPSNIEQLCNSIMELRQQVVGH